MRLKKIEAQTNDGRVELGGVRVTKEEYKLLYSDEQTELVVLEKKKKVATIRKEFYHKLVSSAANTSEGMFYLLRYDKALEAQNFFDKQQEEAKKEKKAKKEKGQEKS